MFKWIWQGLFMCMLIANSVGCHGREAPSQSGFTVVFHPMDHVWWPLGHLDAALCFLGNQRCVQDRELLDGMFVFLSAPSSVQTCASLFTWGAWQAKTFSSGWMCVPARRCETEAFGWFARISIDDNYGQ